MRHVKQLNHLDCGIAVAAMITDRSYAQAQLLDPNPNSSRGFWVDEFLSVCNALNSRNWRETRRGQGKMLKAYGLPQSPAAVLIRQPNHRYGHWIASDGEHVYDSEKPYPIPLTDYDRATWLIVRIVISD